MAELLTASTEQPSERPVTNIRLAAPASELTRILKTFVAKGGTASPFSSLDLEVRAGVLYTDHTNKNQNAVVRASVGVTGASDGTLATNDPQKLIDYVSGWFAPDAPVELSHSGEVITIRSGGKTTRMRSIAVTDVPHLGLIPGINGPSQPWTTSTLGSVNTDPARAPQGSTDWSEWTSRGYVVAHVSTTALGDLLAAGSLLFKHQYRNTSYAFNVTGSGIGVKVQESRSESADASAIEGLEAMVVGGSPTNGFSLLHVTVEPFWETIQSMRVKTATLVRHPDERRVNFVVKETEGPYPITATFTCPAVAEKKT